MSSRRNRLGLIVLLTVAGACPAAEAPAGFRPDRTPNIPPEVVAATLRRSLPVRDQALFRKLALTPAQQDTYVDLQVERILSRDRDILTMKIPVGTDAETVKAMGRAIGSEKTEEFFRRLAERLGPTAAATARAFENTMLLRQQADQVQEVLASLQTPLSIADADRLADLIIAHSTLGPDGKPLPGGKSVRIDATVAAAASLLSRPQQAVLRQVLTDHVSRTAARQRANDLADAIRDALAASGGPFKPTDLNPLVEIILANQQGENFNVEAIIGRAGEMFSAGQLPTVRRILSRPPGTP